MNYSNYSFTLDLQIHQSQISIPVSLNDTARKLYITFIDGRKPYTIPDGCKAIFVGFKPDETTLFNDCIIQENKTVIYEFTEQTANVEGIVNCEIRLYGKDGKQLTSSQFIMIVDENVTRDIALSENESTAIDNIIHAEIGRVKAETGRVEAEKGRVKAEAERESAEEKRTKLANVLESFSPLIPQTADFTDSLNRPCYILNVGEEYKGEAKEVIHHSLVVNFSGGNGSTLSPYIFAEYPIKEFTIKIIGMENSKNGILAYEYNGKKRTYDCSVNTELTPPYEIQRVDLVWGGDLYLCNPNGIKDGKTPYIKDGNWWIDGTDTKVKAEGKDGVGILKVEKTATNGNIDTYTITYTNGSTFTFTVTNGLDGFSPTVSVEAINGGHRVIITDKNGEKKVNILNGADGRGISSVLKTSTNGLVDTYTITFTDNTTATFTVTNGKEGTSVTIEEVSESTASGGSNVVTFSDGKTLTVKNGKDGKDYVLTEADKKEIATASAKFDPTAYRLPILYLTGSTEGMTKENAVTLGYECKDKDGISYEGSCTLKWQGSSSLAWDKKNYTVKFDKAFEVVDGWTAQKKYCLKANWIDHSHSRNVVSAKLWGLVRKNRSNLYSRLKSLPNAGAIDGFPCIIMLNGEFHGLYSFNIPKDGWMFGMGSGTKEAVVGTDNQAPDSEFRGETLLDADGLELEYNSDTFSADEVKESLNTLIRACINSNGFDLDTTIAQYLDWGSAIDYYIFVMVLQGTDMPRKNTLYATFDGVKWYFSAYDMDTTYGLEFDGSKLNRAVTPTHTTFEHIATFNRVLELIYRFKTNELKARYKELRADVLSESRICNYFENYAWDISSPILMEEVKKWTSVRGSAVNGIDQICRWVRQRLEVTDAWIEALPEQETPAEPDTPMINLVPTSTDTDGSVYNGTGYKDNARLSSSGGVSSSALDGSVVTGFIPFKNTDVIRMKGAQWLGATAANGGGVHHYYLNLYDSDKTFLNAMEEAAYTSNFASQVSVVYDNTSGITTFSIINPTADTGAFRVAAQKASYLRINAYGKGADLIVTVNQEIE